MARFPSEPETIKSSEKALERLMEGQPKPLKPKDKPSEPIRMGSLQNFQCPACKETLGEVVTINNRVRGWCGNTHTYVNQEV